MYLQANEEEEPTKLPSRNAALTFKPSMLIEVEQKTRDKLKFKV